MRFLRLWLLLGLALGGIAAPAEEQFLHLDLAGRKGKLPVAVIESPNAFATAVLLPGGDSETGKIEAGRPLSSNFLARSRGRFAAEGLNVVVVFRATDRGSLDLYERLAKKHMAEIGAAIEYAQARFKQPVWLIGTSRGTVSAAAVAVERRDVAGLVLTSSITSGRGVTLESLKLGVIVVPTLVVHHAYDQCQLCVPGEARGIVRQLKAAPVKKLVLVEGGSGPTGSPCGATHWHGYINYEPETVRLIAEWMKNPSN